MKRLISSIMIIVTLLTCIIFNPMQCKNVYAINDLPVVIGAIDYVYAFILASMGIAIPNNPDLWGQIKECNDLADTPRQLIVEGLKAGTYVLTKDVSEEFSDYVEAMRNNGNITVTTDEMLSDYVSDGTITQTILDDIKENAKPSFGYINWHLFKDASGQVITYYSKNVIVNDTSRRILTSSGGIRVLWNKEGSLCIDSTMTYELPYSDYIDILDSNSSYTYNILPCFENVADIPTSTVFPATDDTITELTLPTVFPTNITLEDIAGVPTTEWPIDVGVSTFPNDSDDVDSNTYPWYYPLTKWFKKSIDSIGTLPKSIADSISKVLNPSITAEQEATLKDSFIAKTPIGDLQEIWDSIEDMTTERGAPPVIMIPVGKLWRASTGISYPLSQEEYTLIDFGYINSNVTMPILNMGIIDFLRALLSAGWYYITLMYIWHKVIPKEVIR